MAIFYQRVLLACLDACLLQAAAPGKYIPKRAIGFLQRALACDFRSLFWRRLRNDATSQANLLFMSVSHTWRLPFMYWNQQTTDYYADHCNVSDIYCFFKGVFSEQNHCSSIFHFQGGIKLNKNKIPIYSKIVRDKINEIKKACIKT